MTKNEETNYLSNTTIIGALFQYVRTKALKKTDDSAKFLPTTRKKASSPKPFSDVSLIMPNHRDKFDCITVNGSVIYNHRHDDQSVR